MKRGIYFFLALATTSYLVYKLYKRHRIRKSITGEKPVNMLRELRDLNRKPPAIRGCLEDQRHWEDWLHT